MKSGKSPQEKAVFAGGCFWCLEAIFQRIKGVTSITSGYTGDTTKHPTYEEVCTGSTGHAEAVEIRFDPSMISYEILLDIFFSSHDPTTRNRQGNDIGSQYRSAIFYTGASQQMLANKKKEEIEQAKYYKNPVITDIVPLTVFYPAEIHHQQYYENNMLAPYCHIVITPKIQSLKEKWRAYLKEELR